MTHGSVLACVSFVSVSFRPSGASTDDWRGVRTGVEKERKVTSPSWLKGTGNDFRLVLQPVAKMLRHFHEKLTFSTSNRCLSQVCGYTLTSLLPSIQSRSSKFEHGLVLLATLIRAGERITSTRSWTGHISQNMVECPKFFCDCL